MRQKESKLVKAEGEKVVPDILKKDISSLTIAERSEYLYQLALSKGLDPLTRPFDVLPGQNGKLVVYANSGCADQLREQNNITIELVSEGPLVIGDKIREDVWVVHKRAMMVVGLLTRTHEDVGAVDISSARGEALANAIMRAHTKAERRVTLGIKGLGIPDISELETIPGLGQQPLNSPRVLAPSPSVQPDAPEPKKSSLPPARPPA